MAFVVREDVVELRPETVDLRNLYGVLKRRGQRRPISAQQMDRDIADAVAESVASSRRR